MILMMKKKKEEVQLYDSWNYLDVESNNMWYCAEATQLSEPEDLFSELKTLPQSNTVLVTRFLCLKERCLA